MSAFATRFEARATPRLNARHGESCTYHTSGNGPSGVPGIAVVDEMGAMPDDEFGTTEFSELLVTVQRRASSDNPDALVISDPQLGDGLKREGDDRMFSFTGEAMDVTPDSWRLKFHRKIPTRTGGNFKRGGR